MLTRANKAGTQGAIFGLKRVLPTDLLTDLPQSLQWKPIVLTRLCGNIKTDFYVSGYPSFRTKLTQINVFFLNYMSRYLTGEKKCLFHCKNIFFTVWLLFYSFSHLVCEDLCQSFNSGLYSHFYLCPQSEFSLKQVSHCAVLTLWTNSGWHWIRGMRSRLCGADTWD